jgi:hypothetical protein
MGVERDKKFNTTKGASGVATLAVEYHSHDVSAHLRGKFFQFVDGNHVSWEKSVKSDEKWVLSIIAAKVEKV